MNAVGPAWLRMEAGHWQPIPRRVAVVRRIFALSLDGHGLHSIAAQLNKDKTPGIARSEKWVLSPASARFSAIPPCWERFSRTSSATASRVPEGKCIADYYPVVVDEATFYQVQAALDGRKNQRGPRRTPSAICSPAYCTTHATAARW